MHRPDAAGTHATQTFERVCAFLSTSLSPSDTWSNPDEYTRSPSSKCPHVHTRTQTRTDVCFHSHFVLRMDFVFAFVS